MRVIEEYADSQIEDEQWTLWMAQFPRLYRLSRWLEDYVDLFLSIDRFNENDAFSLDSLLTPRANPHFQGGGIDAPPLTRTLKIGAHLVLRELISHGIIGGTLAARHAYAPIDRIRILFQRFGANIQTSKDIHDLLCEHLGAQGATFGGAYDIPLRIVAADEVLQRKLFG